jgi:hypothetical protein
VSAVKSNQIKLKREGEGLGGGEAWFHVFEGMGEGSNCESRGSDLAVDGREGHVCTYVRTYVYRRLTAFPILTQSTTHPPTPAPHGRLLHVVPLRRGARLRARLLLGVQAHQRHLRAHLPRAAHGAVLALAEGEWVVVVVVVVVVIVVGGGWVACCWLAC